jgi:endonuclease VIII-like 1
MPELAEIKIMADYINNVCREKDFTTISFSESAVDRGLCITQPSNLQIFKITAEARGKELMLTLSQGQYYQLKISCSMGMSGYWFFGDREDLPKHTHMKFGTIHGMENLCLIDVRRFAKWKVVTDWNQNRGPCPLTQFSEFKQHIFDNLHRVEFNKPIHIVLMNQKYFGGIGNYLRAEILFKAKQNPFTDARTAITENPSILDLCNQLPAEAYVLGGGQLKDWKNPFSVPDGGFDEWIQCYGKSENIIDKNGRKFWYSTAAY